MPRAIGSLRPAGPGSGCQTAQTQRGIIRPDSARTSGSDSDTPSRRVPVPVPVREQSSLQPQQSLCQVCPCGRVATVRGGGIHFAASAGRPTLSGRWLGDRPSSESSGPLPQAASVPPPAVAGAHPSNSEVRVGSVTGTGTSDSESPGPSAPMLSRRLGEGSGCTPQTPMAVVGIDMNVRVSESSLGDSDGASGVDVRVAEVTQVVMGPGARGPGTKPTCTLHSKSAAI